MKGKRSSQVQLVMLGTVLIGACSDENIPKDRYVYKAQQECGCIRLLFLIVSFKLHKKTISFVWLMKSLQALVALENYSLHIT